MVVSALPNLDQAYEACRRETAEWAKTFYLGTLLMPAAKRRAIWAIYVWCRRTDELMDSAEAQARPVAELAGRLDRWEERTRKLFAGDVHDGLDLVMRDTIERYPQPLQAYLDMIEGQRMDLNQHRYENFEQLELYCYRVAGTVGLMTQEVMGLDPAYTTAPWSDRPDTSRSAVALGIANQLTNILRDVGEDRGRGRIYLPQEDLARFGYSEEQLLAGVVNDNWGSGQAQAGSSTPGCSQSWRPSGGLRRDLPRDRLRPTAAAPAGEGWPHLALPAVGGRDSR